jgi:DNA-binding GntR family transcriptional regulator
MNSIQRIPRESASLRVWVTTKIRDAILDGLLKPGEKLIERELCSSLGISRTLLREALPLLRAEGLITSIPHRGTFVALIDAAEVKEIYQIRRVLEALATREFARNATDAQMKALRQQFVNLKSSETEGNLRDLLVAKSGFYALLFEGCGYKLISQILTQLNNRVIIYKRLSLSVPGRLPEALDELDALVTAIEARDCDKAAELCETHVANAERTVLRHLSDDSDSFHDAIGASA